MTDYTFLIGKYTDKGLETELAGLLAAGKEASAPQPANKKRLALILPVVMLLVGVYLIVAGVRGARPPFWMGGAIAVIGGAYYAWSSRRTEAERPAAKTLLKSLNAIESSNRAAVLFSDDGMTIRAKNNEVVVPYADVSAAAESRRLYVILHQGAATVLQKQDLLGKTPAAFSGYLAERLPGRYLNQGKKLEQE